MSYEIKRYCVQATQFGDVQLRTTVDPEKTPRGRKALFVQPPINGFVFPTGLSLIVSVALDHGWEAALVDVNAMKTTASLIEDAVAAIAAYKPDIVGVPGFTENFDFIQPFIHAVKAACPDTLVVAGGYWARYSPHFAIEQGGADVVVSGEGELPFSQLLDAFPDRTAIAAIKGVSVRLPDGRINIDTSMPDMLVRLDNQPSPLFDLFDYGNRYIQVSGGDRIGSLLTGRGCVAKCTFCDAGLQRYRTYPSEKIIAEMKFLRDEYGVNYVRFKEALTITKSQQSKRFLQDLADAQLGMKIQVVSRIEGLTDEVVELLKKAGCFDLSVGIETADDHMANVIMKKRNDIPEIKNAISRCNRAGISVMSGFIIGMPEESLSSLLKTLKFIFTCPPLRGSVYFPVPYPGSEIHNYALEKVGLSEDEIMTDPRISTGRNIYLWSYEGTVAFLNKYRFCTLSPHLMIFFYKLYGRALWIQSYRAQGRTWFARYRLARFFAVDLAYEAAMTLWRSVKYRFVKVKDPTYVYHKKLHLNT